MDAAYRHSRAAYSHFYKSRRCHSSWYQRGPRAALLLALIATVSTGCRVREHKLNAESEETPVVASAISLPSERAPLPNQPAGADSATGKPGETALDAPVAPVTAVPDVPTEPETAPAASDVASAATSSVKSTAASSAPEVPTAKPHEPSATAHIPSAPGASLTPPPAPAAGDWMVLVYAGGTALSEREKKELLPSAPQHLDAIALAVQLVSKLERQASTNAALGGALRADGETVETDAIVLSTEQQVGAALGVQHALSPIQLAETLFRADQPELHGQAVDALAERLGIFTQSWRTERTDSEYLYDLAQLFRGGRRVNPIYQLYAPSDKVTQAVAAATRLDASLPSERGPVFALVLGPDGNGALAASYAGTPLLLPGEPTELQHPERLFSLTQGESLLLLPGTCTQSAGALRDELRSFGAVEEQLRKKCERLSFIYVKGKELRTNLAMHQLFLSAGWSLKGTERSAASSSAQVRPVAKEVTP